MFSSVFAKHFEIKSNPSSQIEGHTCYSSWHKKNDISTIVDITAAPIYKPSAALNFVNDGYYCSKDGHYSYRSRKFQDGWLQADLKKLYTLKCIRIFAGTDFYDIEFSFGNYSRDQGVSLNEIFAYSGSVLDKSVVEYCLDRPMVGQFVHIEAKKGIVDNHIHIGEIQILVE